MKRKLIFISSSSDLSGVPVHILNLVKELQDNFDITVISSEGWLTKELEKLKINTEKVELKISNTLSIRKILGRYDSKNSIIHMQGVRAGILGGLASLGLKSKKIYTEHNWTKDYQLDQSWREPIQKSLLKTLANNIEKVICVSEAVKNFYLEENLASENKLIRIYNGVSFIDQSKKFSEPETIGTISSLTKRKRIDLLIKAFAQLITQFPHLRLLIWGDGPEKENLKLLIKELQIQDHVSIKTGKRDKSEFTKKVDIYVQPSRDESFGMSLAEAIGNSMPSLGSDVGAIPELLEEEYLFDDESDLVNKLEEIIKNYDKHFEYFKENKKSFRNKFSIKRMIDENINLYNQILN